MFGPKKIQSYFFFSYKVATLGKRFDLSFSTHLWFIAFIAKVEDGPAKLNFDQKDSNYKTGCEMLWSNSVLSFVSNKIPPFSMLCFLVLVIN